MSSANSRSKGPLVGAAVLAAVALLGIGALVYANEFALEGAIKSAVPGLPAPAPEPVEQPPQSWIQKIFARPSIDARQQAVAQIEAFGLTLDADSYNKV